jgi:AcrR family transcriptional regulator
MVIAAGGRTDEVGGDRSDADVAPVAATSPSAVSPPSTSPAFGDGAGFAPGSAEERVAEAMLTCIGRWGLGKTTIEDVAREAGMSRATVYRLFPGGKHAIVRAGVHTEVGRLVAVLTEDLERCDDLETCLISAVSLSTAFLRRNDALVYLREHEWEAVEAFLAFDRMDTIFLVAGATLGPSLLRFLTPERASQVAMWCARIVVSHLLHPSDDIDLADAATSARIVRTYLMPGLAQDLR